MLKGPSLIPISAAAIALIAVCVVFAGSCGDAGGSRPSRAADRYATAAVVQVRRAPLSNALAIAGEFLPYQEVELHAKVAGYIRNINVDIGDRVHKGQVLAVLEIPELVAQLQRAQAVLNLPAGLPLTSFVTPDGRLYFGAGYLPAEHKRDKPSFREAAGEALKRYANRSRIGEESYQLEVAK